MALVFSLAPRVAYLIYPQLLGGRWWLPMSTDLMLLFLVSTLLVLLCCLNRWLYVCLIALVELI